MKAVFGKITSKARTIVPKDVRGALGVKPGDMLVYRIAKETVTLARAEPIDRAYLQAVESTLTDWASAEDAAAYDKL